MMLLGVLNVYNLMQKLRKSNIKYVKDPRQGIIVHSNSIVVNEHNLSFYINTKTLAHPSSLFQLTKKIKGLSNMFKCPLVTANKFVIYLPCFLYVDVSVILQPLIRLAFFGYHLFCRKSRQEFCNLHNKMSNLQHTLSLIPFTGRTSLFLVELMKGESIDQTRTSVTMTTSWRDVVVWFRH